MRRLFVAIIPLLLSVLVLYAQGEDKKYGKPVIVLIERNPWLMVIGSDTPTFVLYEKGQVIYKRREGDTVRTYEVSLSEEDAKRFIEKLGIGESFYKLPEIIEMSNWTDQPTNTLVVRLSSPKNVNVYGNLRRAPRVGEKGAPPEFLSVYKQLIDFNPASAKIWEPTAIEVMLWDYNYAPNKVIWPKSLPDLKSSSTKKLGSMYSIVIERADFDAFKKFYETVGEKTAVEINGKKMAISYRYPFPNLSD